MHKQAQFSSFFLSNFSFAGFDNTCDLSAVLGMLANASVFRTPTNIHNNAKDVRSKVRNEWGHCNFDHWTDVDFHYCFQLMETLIRSLGLPTADENKVLDNLQDWHTKGKCIYQIDSTLSWVCSVIDDR